MVVVGEEYGMWKKPKFRLKFRPKVLLDLRGHTEVEEGGHGRRWKRGNCYLVA